MENNEIMVNDEVIENAEEITAGKSNKGLLVAAGIGAAVLVGVGIYKIVKKVRAKAKAKKEISEECEECAVEYIVDEE